MTLGLEFYKAAGQRVWPIRLGLANPLGNLVNWGLVIHADFQEVVAKQVTILFSGSIGSLNPILIVSCSNNASCKELCCVPFKNIC